MFRKIRIRTLNSGYQRAANFGPGGPKCGPGNFGPGGPESGLENFGPGGPTSGPILMPGGPTSGPKF